MRSLLKCRKALAAACPAKPGYQKFTDTGSPKDAIRYLRFAAKCPR
jgi:hypothetical protein